MFLLQVVAPLFITPDEMNDLEEVGSICRAASEATIDAFEWQAIIRDAGSVGGLSPDDQNLLVRMCGMYAVAKRDSAREQLAEVQRELDDMSLDQKAVLRELDEAGRIPD
ncbi:hypothetical protein [Blastomonas sp. AAP53]|uniref:hypothetical protein n=1 Tax=Blastomonas sp. AAP53 TaxID=1248760 RepID=UPI0012675F4D|nr:hypothetical protein [Blastomonas sp. AAP53]